MNFAAITLPELAPILTIFVGMLGGFYAISKVMLNSATTEREAMILYKRKKKKAKKKL